jgi:hypothetical protein
MMDEATVFVMFLAVGFFSFVAYLAISSRKAESRQGHET